MRTILSVIALLMTAIPALADSIALSDSNAMIQNASIIAVVEASVAETGTFKGVVRDANQGKTKVFQERTAVRLIQSIKGTAPEDFFVYHTSGRGADSLFRQGGGKYLVFLGGDKTFLTGVNARFSTLPITDSNVEWGISPIELTRAPLDTVVAQIKASADAH